jgi:hypothetical protein
MKRKYPVLNSTADEKKVRTALWKPLCANGVPMGLQYSITAIGSVILPGVRQLIGLLRRRRRDSRLAHQPVLLHAV